MHAKTRFASFGLALFFVAAPAAGQSQTPWGEPIADYGGAKLTKHDWFTSRDYPPEALGGREQGRVVISFEITAEGRAKNCSVAVSSGHRALDRAPCRPLERQARFEPAMGADGTPIESNGVMSIDFWIPSSRR